MTYKGYSASIEVDLEAEILFGRVLDINDVVTFNPHSADVAGILLSVVKVGSQNAFGLNLCGFSVTAACQIYLN